MDKRIFLILTLGIGYVLAAKPEIDDASVTLPYLELAQLVERINSLEDEKADQTLSPPVPTIVHSAQYSLQGGSLERPILRATFDVSNLTEEWQSVPLMDSGQAIHSVTPESARVVESNGGLLLLLEPGERISVTLSLVTRSSASTRSGRTLAVFDAIPATQSVLTLTGWSNQPNVTVSGAVSTNEDHTEFALPSSGDAVRVTVPVNTEFEYANWKGSAQYLVEEAPMGLRAHCRLHLNALDNGRTSEVELQLPRLSNLLKVQSDGLIEKPTRALVEDGLEVRFRWSDEEAHSRTIDLEYTLPMDFDDDILRVEGVTLKQPTQWTQTFYVRDIEGVSLSPIDEDWLETKRVPDWIAHQAGSSELRLIKKDHGKTLELRSHATPRVQTSEATVSLARYTTQIVAEGGMLHQAVITVEHDASAAYRFSLPQGAKLLSCSVEGRPIAPLLLSDGDLEARLPQPQKGVSQTSLAYAYTTSGDKLNPVEGKADLALPLTPLFIHQLQWQVVLPSKYKATALEGNVAIEGGRTGDGPVLLEKQLCHGEAPYAALYYTRRDLNQ